MERGLSSNGTKSWCFSGIVSFLEGAESTFCDERMRVPQKQRPHWQPITRLPLIATAIDGMLETTQEQLETLERVRPKPYVLDDHTVARLIRSFTTQLNDLGLYQEQLARWKRTELSAGQRQEVERQGASS